MAITYPSRVYREKEVMDLWNQYNKEIDEFLMRRDREHLPAESKEEGVYYIAFDDERPVGYTGWTDKSDHWKTSGVKVLDEYRGKGIAAKLIAKRLKKMVGKPAIVMLNNLAGGWADHWKRRGWKTFEEAGDYLDASLRNRYKKFEERSLVYLPDEMTKSWNILCPITDEEVLKFEEW